MLALTAALSACANMPRAPGTSAPSSEAPAPSDEISVAALDPLNAPPPPSATPAAATPAADPLLLVPAQGPASQRVPLGTLNASSDPKPAAKPPTPLAPRDGTAMAKAATPVAAAPPMAAAPSATPAREFVPAPTPPAPAPQAPTTAAAATTPAVPPAPATVAAVTPARPTLQPPLAPYSTPRGIPAAGPAPAPTIEAPGVPPANAIGTRPQRFEEETTIISSMTAAPAVQAREFVPAPVVPVVGPPAPPALGEMPFTQAERNIARRFETLGRLRDEGLITQEEFGRRRAANLGAILPYSQNPPGVGLDRSVPTGDAIVARLGALRRSFELRAITGQQHALERTMILNALLPENPDQRTGRKPPPEDVLQGAAMVGHLEALREDSVITQSELDAERKMIDSVLRTGLFPPKGGETAKPTQAKTAAKPDAPTAAAAAPAGDNPMTTEITGPVLHLASFRSEASARHGWQQVLESNKATLASLKPIIRRVDLGEGRGIFYRLMTGSFPSMSDAEATCVKLKQNNQFCRASIDGT